MIYKPQNNNEPQNIHNNKELTFLQTKNTVRIVISKLLFMLDGLYYSKDTS